MLTKFGFPCVLIVSSQQTVVLQDTYLTNTNIAQGLVSRFRVSYVPPYMAKKPSGPKTPSETLRQAKMSAVLALSLGIFAPLGYSPRRERRY